jgi:hypothetical protein
LWNAKGFSQTLSNETLYEKGQERYAASDWVYASLYLYAYIQRNPPEFQNPDFNNQVLVAYSYSIGQLKIQVNKSKQINQNTDNNGEGSITSGLTAPRPFLPKFSPKLKPLIPHPQSN